MLTFIEPILLLRNSHAAPIVGNKEASITTWFKSKIVNIMCGKLIITTV